MKFSVFLVCLLFWGELCIGQQANEIDSISFEFGELEISANRISHSLNDSPQAIDIITRQEIEALNAQSINEVLQALSGVDLRQRGVHGVQADISIRGGTFEQSLVLLDGVRLTDPQTGHHLMNLPLDLMNIERIELVKGASARLYGQNAFAGAINIVTKKYASRGIQAGIELGSYDFLNFRGLISLPIGNLKQSISGTYRSSDGYRYNTDYDIANLFYQGQYSFQRSVLDLTAGYTDRAFGANGFYGREDFTEQFETVQTFFSSLSWKFEKEGLKINPRLSFRKNKDNWQFNRADPMLFQNFHSSSVLTAETQLSYTSNYGQTGLGVEYNYLYLSSSNLLDSLNSGIHKRNQLGLYLDHQIKFLNNRIVAIPSVLFLSMTDQDPVLLPGLDLGYTFATNFKLFGNIGFTNRIPTYTDLYYEDRGNLGNPNLETEEAYGYELGLKHGQENYTVSLSYFARHASNQIDWFKMDEMDRWMPDNFNSASYKGFELNLNHSWANSILKRLRLGYTYLSANFDQPDFAFSRNQLENLQHQLIVSPNFSYSDFSLRFVFKYNDRVSLEDYYLVDAHLNYQYKAYDLYLKANNLFDSIYRETNLVLMPGRWIVLGFKKRME